MDEQMPVLESGQGIITMSWIDEGRMHIKK
jgi:hypothetical protein